MPQIANGDTGAATRARINAVLPQTVAFAAAVPLDGRKVMAPQSVAGPLAFVPAAAPALGAECYVRLTADGANAPSFAGFVEHGASAGYHNGAGVVNLVRFWFDGSTSYYAVSQALGVVPLAIGGAAVPAGAAGTLVLTFGRDMNTGAVPAAGAFALTNSGGADAVTGATWTDARTLTLAKSRTTLAGDTLTLAYTPPGSNALADTSGNQVSAANGLAVTNGVAAGGSGSGTANYLRLVNRGAALDGETADGSGWDYTSSSAGNYGQGAAGYPAKTLPASTDGWFAATVANGSASGQVVSFCTNQAPTTFTDTAFGLFASGGVYAALVGGSFPAVANSVAASAGDVLRVRRVGTTGYCEVSKDGGATFPAGQIVWTGTVTAAALRPFVETPAAGAAGRISLPRASASVA